MTKQRLYMPFNFLIMTLGVAVIAETLITLPIERYDLRFILLLFAAIFVISRSMIKIPGVAGQFSISDTFIFYTMLLYGGDIAILLAACDGIFSSYRFNKKITKSIYNGSVQALCTFFTMAVMRYFFGPVYLLIDDYSPTFIMALCLMTLCQYLANSFVAAVDIALMTGSEILETWKKHFLWVSIAYFAAGSAAGIMAKITSSVGFYAFVVTAPIIAIIYFTYRTYLQNIENSTAHAEQAEKHVQELSRYIAEQDRIREQFAQLEKLSALGELSSGVAHDFNNTLAGILGRAQLLKRTRDFEEIDKGLDLIIKTAEDGAKTIKRIQDFARQRKDHDFAPVDIDQILFDVSEITKPRWKDKAEADDICFYMDLNNNSKAAVMGDASELREVLVNMVFNAIDAMPHGGTISLTVHEVGESVEVMVSDTGMGMSNDVRTRVFDPFFTTKGKAGLGLGLAVSYGIISRHEGTIEVDSEKGRGTTFRIRLPRMKSTELLEVPVEQSPAPLKLVSTHKTRILVTDDEDYVRDLLRDILVSEGYEVVTASSGHEALALFDENEFDGVFTDIGMPGMSGWELSRFIRERNANVPILAITGWGDTVGENEQKQGKVDWVVAKPFSVSKVLELAHTVAVKAKSREESLQAAA